jgi:hypothetical protein
MPRKTLMQFLEQEPATWTPGEHVRLAVAALRVSGLRTPLDRVYRSERPPCGARCRDGHPCQAPAMLDRETGCYVRNGRCRLHGGLSTGPRTAAGRARIAAAQRRRWRQTRGETGA